MSTESVHRRLAAILAADVVAYSRLMGVDEEGTLAALTGHLDELIEPCIAAHRGRVVKTTGDGLLAEFASVVDAVRCAVAFQDGMMERNAEVPEDRRIAFRVGVNLGDVIVRDGDVFGDGVNIAARLEGLAEPGGICVSEMVHQTVDSKIEHPFEDLGPQRVKNIGKPVRAFALRLRREDARRPGDASKTDPPMPARPSIAVLPFENMSADAEQEYFSDGITEDIITELSKISGLFVIARHSAFTYKGKPVTLKQVGRELGVRYVMEGSVRRAGNRLRITAQLIDAETDHHLWAERFDRDIEDIFAVQDEVARRVADALAVTLKPGERERLAHAPTDNLEAYNLYLRARATAWPPNLSNILSARNAYARVIEIDPTFAGGHAGKSITHAMEVLFGHSSQPEKAGRLALDSAERAVTLDPEFARSHSALGMAYTALGQHDRAVLAAARAIELQPGDADSHSFHGRSLMFAGDGERACDAIRTALRLDPNYVEGPYLNLLGRASFISGRFDDAVDAIEQNLARGGPSSGPGLTTIVWTAALGLLGRRDDAERVFEQHVEPSHPGLTLSQVRELPTTINALERDLLIDGLRKAGLPE
jgi:adenylate cyclase